MRVWWAERLIPMPMAVPRRVSMVRSCIQVLPSRATTTGVGRRLVNDPKAAYGEILRLGLDLSGWIIEKRSW